VKKNSLLIVLAIALLVLLGAVTYATADSATYYGTDVSPAGDATGTVSVTATVNPKINLTIETPDAAQTVDFGTVYPGDVIPSKTVTLTVDSNVIYSLATAPSGDVAELALVTVGTPTGAWGSRGANREYYDDYTITPPWDTAPGVYNAEVQYTVTQL